MLGLLAVTDAALYWQTLGYRILDVAVFGLLGVILLLAGFKAFDLILPRLDFQEELGSKRNVPLAIVVAAFLIAIAIIVYAAMHG